MKAKGVKMSSKMILAGISELMDNLQEVGEVCLIKKGCLTVSVVYDRSSPEKERVKKILAEILEHTPGMLGKPPRPNMVELVSIVIHLRHGRIDAELELPSVIP